MSQQKPDEESKNDRTPVRFTVENPFELRKAHRFDKLMGMDGIVDMLRQNFIMPQTYPFAFSKSMMPQMMPNMLFYGPAGTGKTEIVLSLAAEMGVPLIRVSPAEMYSSYQGETVNRFRDLLRQCEEMHDRVPEKKIIVFFDEADNILSISRESKGSSDANIVQVFKEYVNVTPTRGKVPEYIIWIAATNYPDGISDIGVLSRFPIRRFVGFACDDTMLLRYYMLMKFASGIVMSTCRDEAAAARISSMFDVNSVQCRDTWKTRYIRDLDRVVWFLSPREMTVIVKEALNSVAHTPMKIDKYDYQTIEGSECVNPVEASDDDRTGNNIYKLSDAIRYEMISKGVNWDEVDINVLNRAILSARVSTALTWSALYGFWKYAKNEVQDVDGLKDIYKLMYMGFQDGYEDVLLSDDFKGTALARNRIPSWPILESGDEQLIRGFNEYMESVADVERVPRREDNIFPRQSMEYIVDEDLLSTMRDDLDLRYRSGGSKEEKREESSSSGTSRFSPGPGLPEEPKTTILPFIESVPDEKFQCDGDEYEVNVTYYARDDKDIDCYLKHPSVAAMVSNIHKEIVAASGGDGSNLKAERTIVTELRKLVKSGLKRGGVEDTVRRIVSDVGRQALAPINLGMWRLKGRR